jgi:hypothetical protein
MLWLRKDVTLLWEVADMYLLAVRKYATVLGEKWDMSRGDVKMNRSVT